MDQTDVADEHQRALRRIFFLSWVAYIRPVVLFATLTVIGLLVSQSAKAVNIILTGYVILFIGIIKFFYDISWRRRFRFYCDGQGVWLIRGFLPWHKGRNGLTWLEIDAAACQSGPLSWLTKSYDILIANRFSESRQLTMTHIKHGDQAVAIINDKLAQEFSD